MASKTIRTTRERLRQTIDLNSRQKFLSIDGWLRVPDSMFTLDGFREWFHSDPFPRRVWASFLNGEVYLELGASERRFPGPADAPDASLRPSSGRFFTIDGWFYILEDVFTLDGFRRWVHSERVPEKLRCAYLDGEVYIEMSPEEINSHLIIKGALTTAVHQHLQRQDRGQVFLDGTLVVHDATGLSNEPDLTVCLRETLESGRATPREWTTGSERYIELAGSPDITVEIISRSSTHKDTAQLPTLYFASGVQEYWLIDARGGEVDFRLFVHGSEGFEQVLPDDEGFVGSDVLQARVRIQRRDDRAGLWLYRVELDPLGEAAP
jgi:Uma2 family endonuclease